MPGVYECLHRKTIKIMVWGCVSYFGTGDLVFVDGNMNSQKYIQVLDNHLKPSADRLFGQYRWVLQEDNASIHKSRLTEEYKIKNHIPILNWPAQSPDLLWLVLKRKVKRRVHLITSVEDLKRELLTAWENIPLVFIRSLYESLPRRLRKVLLHKGHITKY